MEPARVFVRPSSPAVALDCWVAMWDVNCWQVAGHYTAADRVAIRWAAYLFGSMERKVPPHDPGWMSAVEDYSMEVLRPFAARAIEDYGRQMFRNRWRRGLENCALNPHIIFNVGLIVLEAAEAVAAAIEARRQRDTDN